MRIDDVIFETAGKIARKENPLEIIYSPLEKDIQSMLKTESGRMACPFCQDDDVKRNNLYAQIKNQVFFCFRCRERRFLR